ncbi:hypothetical protein PBI_PERCIVAL_40 [Microbacterium phage Percival]|uniref:Uncharacterized protein n=1 Tax=Microbacterium phage Percival TaxID=2201439 RepID=A0A2Z4Q719_9CAUD|nr:hypothetical protein PBI_PERCIVAL_40 [Microbacterium phage Percival]
MTDDERADLLNAYEPRDPKLYDLLEAA